MDSIASVDERRREEVLDRVTDKSSEPSGALLIIGFHTAPRSMKPRLTRYRLAAGYGSREFKASFRPGVVGLRRVVFPWSQWLVTLVS